MSSCSSYQFSVTSKIVHHTLFSLIHTDSKNNQPEAQMSKYHGKKIQYRQTAL